MENFTKIIQSIFIISVPFIIFLKPENFIEIVHVEILYISLLILLTYILIILFSKIIQKILLKKFQKINLADLTFILGIVFFELFYHQKIRNIIIDNFGVETSSSYLISLFIITLINIITFIMLIKYYEKVKLTILIFMFLLISISYLKNISIYKSSFISKSDKSFFYKSDLPSGKLLKNIYLIVLDEMTSLDHFLTQFPEENENIDNFEEKLKNKNFHIIDKSLAAYNITYLNLTGLINGNYFIDDKSPKYFSRNSFFPNSIFYNQKNSLQVIDYLRKNNNFINMTGNSEMDFQLSSTTKNIQLNNSSLIIPNIFYKFFEPTYIDELFRRLVQDFLVKSDQDIFTKNNGMKVLKSNLKSYLKINDKGLFFVHHFGPHAPYLYDKNCNKRLEYNKISNPKSYHPELYKDSYICVTNQILELIDEIEVYDKDSIIIFQGDHSNSRKRDVLERFYIFNSIRLPKKCKNFINENLNNINSFRLALFCSAGEVPILYEDKSFIGYHGNELDYGNIKRLKSN